MIGGERVHYFRRAVASVVNIPHDVQFVDCHALNQITHADNEIFRVAEFDNFANDSAVVFSLGYAVIWHVDEFVDYVAILRRNGFTHFGARVFRGRKFYDFYQTP